MNIIIIHGQALPNSWTGTRSVSLCDTKVMDRHSVAELIHSWLHGQALTLVPCLTESHGQALTPFRHAAFRIVTAQTRPDGRYDLRSC